VTLAEAPRVAIRDLDDAAFRERYGCDRFTATVLGNRFDYLVEHMSVRLLWGAFSPVLRDFYDLAATISGPPSRGYQVPAASNGIVLMAGTTIDAVRNTVEEWGADRLRPGDVLIANDPYRTGNHVNDLLFVRPVFHDGEIAAFVNLNAHQLDMGGTVPGGFSSAKANVYESGLVISPRLLVAGGEPVRETWSLIFDNVRMGAVLLPDMQTVCSSLELGERLLGESIERYGLAAVHGAIDYACDVAAEQMAAALARLPDGEWSGYERVDCDAAGEDEDYEVRVRIVKRGDRVEVDLSGTSRQARSSINATALDVKTTVGIALKFLFAPHGRFNSGLFRNVDIVLPEGTILSALPPDGAVFMYFEQNQVLLSALLRALEGAVGEAAIAGDRGSPNLHVASGLLPDGTPWVAPMQCGGEVGPFGANRFGDADTQAMSYQANGVAPEIEAVEKSSPVLVLRHEPVPDTAGPGTHRGGCAVLRDSLWLTDAQHSLNELRYKHVPGFGVQGGGEGATGGVWAFPPAEDGSPRDPGRGPGSYAAGTPLAGIVDPRTKAPSRDGEYVFPFPPGGCRTLANAVLRYLTNGAGGWGDPLERDPEKVKVDVRDGYVTIEGAARDYGVVVVGDPDRDPEGLAVDLETTRRLRERRRRQRG